MLWLRGILFTIFVPCAVGVFVPLALADGLHLNAGVWITGWILVLAGTVIYFMCLIRFLLSGGTPALFFTHPLRTVLGEEPPRLVQSWLYGWSRNPMYMGVILLISGWAVVFASLRVAIYGICVFLCFHLIVVYLEEPHLRRQRGPAYVEYCRRVPRWIGRAR
jgi:protein-S-isoprenylcysteine O-methyltransferase Ste14